jgi:hypothetical protein
LGVDIVCTTNASVVSSIDVTDPSKVNDYVLLSHLVVFSPKHESTTRGFDRYKIEIRPLTDAGLEPSTRNIVLVQHQPSQTTSLTTYSASTGVTIGGSVGFFGDVPTADVSGSWNFSKSQTWNIPDVSCDDHSSSSAIIKVFKLNSSGSKCGVFQIAIDALFRLPDELLTSTNRHKKAKDAAKWKFDICFTAEHDITEAEKDMCFHDSKNSINTATLSSQHVCSILSDNEPRIYIWTLPETADHSGARSPVAKVYFRQRHL